MDPASAVGVAAAAAQFLGIALKAIRLCYQIRDNADSATDRNRELEELARELKGSNANLTCSTAGRVPRRITNVANKCDRLTKDVLDLLQDVRGGGKNIGTARKLYRVMKESKRIERLERSLKEEEQTLESLLVKDIWSVTHANSATSITQFKSLDAKVECLIRSLGKSKALETERATKMLEGIAAARAVVETKLDQTAIDVTQKIAQADTNGLERHRVTERSARERHQSTIQKQREEEFLGSLFFREMDDRQINIRDAAPDTLEWIFYDPDTHVTASIGSSKGKITDFNAKWDNFYKWLRTESTPYWICGKLGSGKSTLMAHIVEDPRTRKGLDIWKDHGRLCVFRFFFWRPGSVLQKSCLGLLRSLLYQVCQAEPQLIPEILSTFPTNGDVLPVWTTRALSTGIAKAFEIGDHLRICIFIDGLDEFLGDYNELLDLILEIQVYNHVKVCVSSRPENQIIRRLSHCPQLQLEDLNDSDINSFVSQKLEKANVHLPRIGYRSASSYLTRKAEGVFLYAALVTQTVVQGAYDGDDEETLLERITSVPMGIREVFKSFIDGVNNLQKQSLAFYVSIMNLSDSTRKLVKIPIITLARMGPQLSATRLEDMPQLCSQTETQIRGHSAGLLDIVKVKPRLDIGMDRDTWLHPNNARWLSPADFISDENWTRRKVVGQVPPYPSLFNYETRALDWVHRSAHDFIHDPVFVRDLSVSVQPMVVTLQKVLAGYILSFALAPSVSSRYTFDGTPSTWRLWETIEALATIWPLSPSAVARATDCLYSVCLQCDADEFSYFFGIPEPLVLDCLFWNAIVHYGMFEYGLERIHKISIQALPYIIRSMVQSNAKQTKSRMRAKLFNSLLASLQNSGFAVQRFRRKPHEYLRLLTSQTKRDLVSFSYKSLIDNHASYATETEIFNARTFVEILECLICDPAGFSPTLTTVTQLCAISDSTGVFVGIASNGGRLYLQIAGSLFLDPQGLVYHGFRRLSSLGVQAKTPLVRLICIPKHFKAGVFHLDFKDIESFIKIDLEQRTAIVLLNLLRNDLVNPISLLDLPVQYNHKPWPLIFATKEEFRNCHQLIVEDTRSSEQLQNSTEKLLALECVRVHLWDLLYSIWVRLLEKEDTDVNSSPRYSDSKMDQENEEVAEDDRSEWCTDEEELHTEEQVDEDNDSDWWTDEEEISETRRWLRIRDRMTIVQRNGDDLSRDSIKYNYPVSGKETDLTCGRLARMMRLAARRPGRWL